MESFTIYRAVDGAILRSGFSNVPASAQPLAEGEALLAGIHANWETERVDIEADPPAIVSK